MQAAGLRFVGVELPISHFKAFEYPLRVQPYQEIHITVFICLPAYLYGSMNPWYSTRSQLVCVRMCMSAL